MNRYLEKYILRYYDSISFDIFDTLVERDIDDPRDIFDIVENEMRENGFRQRRIEAENRARLKKMSREVVLDEIYDELQDTINDREILKKCEVKTELEHIFPKRDIICFFNRCIAEEKDIYLISDMYLPESVIKQILNKCGINRYNKLYLSNKYGANKISSKLFEILLEKESIDHGAILHIGDSIRADFFGARGADIKSILVGRKKRFKRMINKICQQK
ncbi:MAG: HAD hydrolase-like protein [Lachnospiraceae bacterium]|nr:HAD hydrolase-like protein [Lachnospiraceae bacterium]